MLMGYQVTSNWDRHAGAQSMCPQVDPNCPGKDPKEKPCDSSPTCFVSQWNVSQLDPGSFSNVLSLQLFPTEQDGHHFLKTFKNSSFLNWMHCQCLFTISGVPICFRKFPWLLVLPHTEPSLQGNKSPPPTLWKEIQCVERTKRSSASAHSFPPQGSQELQKVIQLQRPTSTPWMEPAESAHFPSAGHVSNAPCPFFFFHI